MSLGRREKNAGVSAVVLALRDGGGACVTHTGGKGVARGMVLLTMGLSLFLVVAMVLLILGPQRGD